MKNLLLLFKKKKACLIYYHFIQAYKFVIYSNLSLREIFEILIQIYSR